MITHDSNGGHSDLWDCIDGNASRISEAEERIAKLEESLAKLDRTVSVYGELIDTVRNKVYALEHRRAGQ